MVICILSCKKKRKVSEMAEAYGHMHFIMSCVIPVTFPKYLPVHSLVNQDGS